MNDLYTLMQCINTLLTIVVNIITIISAAYAWKHRQEHEKSSQEPVKRTHKPRKRHAYRRR